MVLYTRCLSHLFISKCLLEVRKCVVVWRCANRNEHIVFIDSVDIYNNLIKYTYQCSHLANIFLYNI